MWHKDVGQKDLAARLSLVPLTCVIHKLLEMSLQKMVLSLPWEGVVWSLR